MRFRLLALFGMFLLAAVPAAAEDLRFPATGLPAVTMHAPDTWTSRTDDDGNLLLASSDHGIVIVLSLVAYSGSLDDLAAEALKVAKSAAPSGKEAATVAGLSGFAYHSAMTNPAGIALNLKLIAVHVDAVHTFTCTLISALPDGDSLLTPGNEVIGSMRLADK